jgi:glycosyltransferase involved in cell wall biosynthesis
MDAALFAARELARPWQEGGFLRPGTPIFEIMEGSSSFCLRSRQAARARTGLEGEPLCLWVGRLNRNKDPLTVLEGFAGVLDHLPKARLTMAYGEDDLLPEVEAWRKAHPRAAAHVTLLGRVAHRDLEAVYNSADLFVLGSHHEGSGYAVLEALSCGVVPIVTDIPSFRVLTGRGEIGALWPVGDAAALSHTLMMAASARRVCPEVVRSFFDERFSFPAIGRQALAAYIAVAGDIP